MMEYTPGSERSPENNEKANTGGHYTYQQDPYYHREQYEQPNFGDVNGFFSKWGKVIPYEVWGRERRNLQRLSAAAALSVLGYIVFSSVFTDLFRFVTMLIKKSERFDYDAFCEVWNLPYMQSAFNMIYSIVIVGCPFFIMYLITKKKGIAASIPMGKPKNAKFLPLIVLGGFGVCLSGNIVTSYFSAFFKSIFDKELTIPEQTLSHDIPGIILLLFGTAVVPALIEEMALRGIVMQALRRYGDWFAIICTAVIFGFMHCNLLQIPFAIIAGIAIGYATVATESVWTGVLIHFCNNAFSVVVSLVGDSYGYDSSEYTFCNVIFYLIILIGLICAFIFVKKINKTQFRRSPLINKGKRLIPPPFYCNSATISYKTLYFSYFCTAPMIIAFLGVLFETALVLMQY